MLTHTKPIILLVLAILSTGCEPERKNPMDMKFSDTYDKPQRVNTDPKNQPPVLVGKLPLVYIAEFACSVRVMDVDNKKKLAEHPINAGGIVMVDSNKGIRIGDEFTQPKTLDPAGHYAIYLDRE